MRSSFILALAALIAVPIPGRAQDSSACERQWTFPVPFYQSVAWSPDGSRIAFSAITTTWDDGYGIFVVNADGSGLTRIDTGGAAALYPVFSPDGSQIAFSSKRDDNTDVSVMRVDGTGATRLTQHEANDGYPTWSPDGARIAFHTNRDGNYEIYVMNTDGSDPVRLTDHPADDYNPAWSPDGSRIAFDSDRDEIEGDEIYVVGPDGSGLAQVVEKGVFPAWSPDGKKFLFAWKGAIHGRRGWLAALSTARERRLWRLVTGRVDDRRGRDRVRRRLQGSPLSGPSRSRRYLPEEALAVGREGRCPSVGKSESRWSLARLAVSSCWAWEVGSSWRC